LAMSKDLAAYFRRRSGECLAAVGRTTDAAERLELFQLAQGYIRLAKHTETLAKQRPSDE
jgi:hypothetical protein